MSSAKVWLALLKSKQVAGQSKWGHFEVSSIPFWFASDRVINCWLEITCKHIETCKWKLSPGPIQVLAHSTQFTRAKQVLLIAWKGILCFPAGLGTTIDAVRQWAFFSACLVGEKVLFCRVQLSASELEDKKNHKLGFRCSVCEPWQQPQQGHKNQQLQLKVAAFRKELECAPTEIKQCPFHWTCPWFSLIFSQFLLWWQLKPLLEKTLRGSPNSSHHSALETMGKVLCADYQSGASSPSHQDALMELRKSKTASSCLSVYKCAQNHFCKPVYLITTHESSQVSLSEYPIQTKYFQNAKAWQIFCEKWSRMCC